jgi:hypothetical protein
MERFTNLQIFAVAPLDDRADAISVLVDEFAKNPAWAPICALHCLRRESLDEQIGFWVRSCLAVKLGAAYRCAETAFITHEISHAESGSRTALH